MLRGTFLNSTKLATYDHIKHTLINEGYFEEGYSLHFISSLTAGFFMAVVTAPFDICRTRIMNQPVDKKIYNGLIDVFTRTVKDEGIKGLYKGFLP